MDNLALKLVLTPALIGAATLVGRRWGQSVGGWLVGLPLTTGPVAFFIALDHGAAFGAAAVVGSLAGAVAEAATCRASSVRTSSTVSSRRVSRHDGSSPTTATPRATQGCRRATFHSA